MQLGKICDKGIWQGERAKGTGLANDYEKRMNRVVEYMHDNPAGDLSLDRLAEVAALSRFHFHRVYRGLMAETSAQTVRRMRLHRAAVALVQSGERVERIAKSVGYPNLASFSRAFADHYQATPATFRKRGELRPFTLNSPVKGKLMYPVTIRSDPARRLACIAHRGPYPDIGRAFEKLSVTISARGLFDRVRGMVGVYYDSPADVSAADLRSNAGFEVSADAAIDLPLEQVVLPGGRHAVLTFRGPYVGLPAAYDQLFGLWLPGSGEGLADSPIFERYLNSPMDTAPEDLVTEICALLT